MLNNRLEEELRKVLITKSDKGQVIEKGPVKLNDLKDGESVKRYIKGEIVEYVRYKNELFSTKYSNNKDSFNVSRFDTNETLLSTPNWDSGWVTVSSGAGSNVDFFHYLGTKYLLLVGYFKYLLGSTEYFFNLNLHTLADEDQGSHAAHGLTIHMQNNDKINIGIADDYVFSHDNTATFSGSYKEISSGELRLFAWKFNPTDTTN